MKSLTPRLSSVFAILERRWRFAPLAMSLLATPAWSAVDKFNFSTSNTPEDIGKVVAEENQAASYVTGDGPQNKYVLHSCPLRPGCNNNSTSDDCRRRSEIVIEALPNAKPVAGTVTWQGIMVRFDPAYAQAAQYNLNEIFGAHKVTGCAADGATLYNFSVREGEWNLSIQIGGNGFNHKKIGAIDYQWHTMVAESKVASAANGGYVKLYFDGVLKHHVTGNTAYCDFARAKFGIYAVPPGEAEGAPDGINMKLRVGGIATGVNTNISAMHTALTGGTPPPTEPDAPSDLIATATSASQINLAWTDASTNETGFKIERATGAAAFNQIATTGANAVSFNNTGLTAATDYSYRIRATNSGGDSGYSNTASATTDAADTTPPIVAISAPADGATVSGSVAVSATASDNVGVVGVQFKLDGANLGAEDTGVPYAVTWNAATSANGSHTLTAVARDLAGNSTTSSVVSVTVNNPPVVHDANSLLPVAAISVGDTVTSTPITGASGGDALRLDGNAANDFVTLNVPVAATNSYQVSVRYHKNAFRGICQLAINNGTGFVNRGAAQDLYVPTASAGFVTVDLGTVTLDSGTRTFRFTVTGKNAASSGFQVAIDTITLTPQ